MTRLIDADKLKLDIVENSIVLGGVMAIETECAKALIDIAHTIEERKKGEWIDNGQGYHFCKSCGYFALFQTRDMKNYFEKLSNFCPNCGADMREADKNETKDS